MKKTLLFVLCTGGWDYLSVDPATQRIFASHGGIVEVVDIKADGIAVASDVGKDFISNGQSP